MVAKAGQSETIAVHGFSLGDIAVFECPCGECGNIVLLNRKTEQLVRIPAHIFERSLNAMITIQTAIERGELPRPGDL